MSKRMMIVQQMFTASKYKMEEDKRRGCALCAKYGYEACFMQIPADLDNLDNRRRCEIASDIIGGLSECDAAVFMRSWEICPTCKLVHDTCRIFGIPTFYEDAWTPWDEIEE